MEGSESKIRIVESDDPARNKINQDETIKKYAEALIPYDISLIGHGKGFLNSTSTMCYHNSLMQCLLSLPSIYKVIVTGKQIGRAHV